jgi:hypothetical protein
VKPAHDARPGGDWDADATAEREEDEGAGVRQEALVGIGSGELPHERGRVIGGDRGEELREEPLRGVAAEARRQQTEEGECQVGETVAVEMVGHGEEGGRGVAEEARRGGEEDAEEGEKRERRDGERVAVEEGEEVRGGEGREEAEERRGRGGRERRGVDGEGERDLGRGDEEGIGLGRRRGRERRPWRGVPWGRNGRRGFSGRRAALDGAGAEGSAHCDRLIDGGGRAPSLKMFVNFHRGAETNSNKNCFSWYKICMAIRNN